MKYTLSIFIIAFTSLSFCQTSNLERENIEEMFDEINKSDASHVGEKVRDTIFVKNFNLIIDLINNQGYPKFLDNKGNKKLNQSIENGTMRTFLHVLQTKPELLLNKEIIDLISKEVTQQRLDTKLLKFVLSSFQYDQDIGNIVPWSEIIEGNFYLAIKEWEIKLYTVKQN